jgi:hypothetical protein
MRNTVVQVVIVRIEVSTAQARIGANGEMRIEGTGRQPHPTIPTPRRPESRRPCTFVSNESDMFTVIFRCIKISVSSQCSKSGDPSEEDDTWCGVLYLRILTFVAHDANLPPEECACINLHHQAMSSSSMMLMNLPDVFSRLALSSLRRSLASFTHHRDGQDLPTI